MPPPGSSDRGTMRRVLAIWTALLTVSSVALLSGPASAIGPTKAHNGESVRLTNPIGSGDTIAFAARGGSAPTAHLTALATLDQSMSTQQETVTFWYTTQQNGAAGDTFFYI